VAYAGRTRASFARNLGVIVIDARARETRGKSVRLRERHYAQG